jgi:hypothetical protein
LNLASFVVVLPLVAPAVREWRSKRRRGDGGPHGAGDVGKE